MKRTSRDDNRTLNKSTNGSLAKIVSVWKHSNDQAASSMSLARKSSTVDQQSVDGVDLTIYLEDAPELTQNIMSSLENQKRIVSNLPSKYHMVYNRKKGHRVFKPMAKSSSLYKLTKQRLLSQNQFTNL